jgi:hypothetical protein
MRSDHGLTKTLCLLAIASLLSPPVFPSKATFERTKPHVNVGTMPAQEPRILLYRMPDTAADAANAIPCRVTLLAADITPATGPRLVIIAEDIELHPGQSVAVAIPPVSTPERREVRVDINPAEDATGPCPLMVSAAGYDKVSEATEYYLDIVGPARWYQSEVPPDGTSSPNGPAPTFAHTLGFAGGNAAQSLRVVGSTPEDTARQNPGIGVQCDYSGTLLIERVPLLGKEPDNVVRRSYPVQLQQGRVILDTDFSEFGARPGTRVDVVARYEFNVPLNVGACADFDLTMQVIDRETGETAAAMKPFFYRYRPQFY